VSNQKKRKIITTIRKNKKIITIRKNKKNNNNDDASDFIESRENDYSKWYNDIIRVTDLAETSPVRGCMVIKPWGMSIWDNIRNDLDARIKEHGAENAYFPLLIPKSFLSKEAEHVDGFAKECAVVTHHKLIADPDGEKGLIADPDAELEDPLIIRPTSETMIWNMFKKWIISHRDLPLKVNQWANVMRWELRTRPFLRTSEFLWQEGHTAHATAEGAIEDSKAMIDNYALLAKELLAIPVVKGCKSPSERFAGAEETYTIEALMQNGWALQSGTSHFLGQSFGKAFDVTFQDKDGKQSDVWGTSWGVSTRLIGALIMTHSDDAGLVLPPRVAPVQVVIVPIEPKKSDVEGKAALNDALDDLVDSLKAKGLKVKVDDRDYVRNGAKYFEWERKGVPLRIELGPRDVAKRSCVFKYRTVKEGKDFISLDDAAEEAVKGLDEVQQGLFEAASERLQSGTNRGATYEEMRDVLMADEAGVFPGAGLYLVPWKCDAVNEDKIKEECKATIRCYPLDENKEGMVEGKTCFYSGEPATHMALFGRAY
jgi:prolyl-tRNA synthetase